MIGSVSRRFLFGKFPIRHIHHCQYRNPISSSSNPFLFPSSTYTQRTRTHTQRYICTYHDGWHLYPMTVTNQNQTLHMFIQTLACFQCRYFGPSCMHATPLPSPPPKRLPRNPHRQHTQPLQHHNLKQAHKTPLRRNIQLVTPTRSFVQNPLQ